MVAISEDNQGLEQWLVRWIAKVAKFNGGSKRVVYILYHNYGVIALITTSLNKWPATTNKLKGRQKIVQLTKGALSTASVDDDGSTISAPSTPTMNNNHINRHCCTSIECTLLVVHSERTLTATAIIRELSFSRSWVLSHVYRSVVIREWLIKSSPNDFGDSPSKIELI